MYLSSIRLFNFRNHKEAKFDFSNRVNCFLGLNGTGKTNLLDAIYYLALTKSAFQKQDFLSISHDEDTMLIEGNFVKKKEKEKITLSIQRGQKKIIQADQKAYNRISEHIGKYPIVLIAPDDTDIIRDAASVRRKFFDGIIAQFDQGYLKDFQQYNKLLDQRNSLLKQFMERAYFDQEMLDSYSQPLVVLAINIAEKRRKFLKLFEPTVRKHYGEISNNKEEINISYESEVQADFGILFKNNENRDRQIQRTSLGIHKDDFIFSIDNNLAKKFASQGQKKSFVLALRMAQFEQLENEKGMKPILLLDDIFDKLDDTRIQKLIEKIDDDTFGQVFISEARPERTRGALANVKAEVSYFDLQNM